MEPEDKLYLENIVEFCDDIDSAKAELSINYDSFVKSSALKAVLAFFVQQIGENAFIVFVV